MTPEIKTKWVEALRSGKYNQGSNCLKVENLSGKFFHCCLGVLCEVMEFPSIQFDTDYDHEFKHFRFVTDDNDVLAASVSEDILPIDMSDKLIDMNDIEKKSFNEIADWVEENL